MSGIITSVILLGGLCAIGAVLLYLVAKKFRVDEDPRISAVAEALPGANCGGCGNKGCRDFAAACVKGCGSLDGKYCPVGGKAVMERVATILGIAATTDVKAQVATLLCNGACSARRDITDYDGPQSCAIMAMVGSGTHSCAYGCLGCGDCVNVCQFGAMTLDHVSGLPKIDAARCTGCGACAKICPRRLIELRPPAGKSDRHVWVACSNRDKGAEARRACAAACIGCGKCSRNCPAQAITITANVAYIDPRLCTACGTCAELCPTGAILSDIPTPHTAPTPASHHEA